MKVLAPGAVTFATATRSHKCIGENTCICVRGEQRCAQARKVWAQRDRISRSIPGAGVCCLVEQADDLDLGGNGAVSKQQVCASTHFGVEFGDAEHVHERRSVPGRSVATHARQ